jgi:transposase InsO family protein
VSDNVPPREQQRLLSARLAGRGLQPKEKETSMHNPTAYLKMRVLGAIDMAEGNSIRDRIKAVSQMTFTDEDGHARQFTWRTIETWLCRYNKHGVTALDNQIRADKGRPRKIVLEDLQAAIAQVLPKLRGRTPTRGAIYRLCIEQGLLHRSQVAPNTFRRLVKQYEMLKPESAAVNKHRLAFAKAHANEMWQADTLYGPYVQHHGAPVQTRLIAFLDDASRVCCHGQFFLAETTDTLIEALRAAFYKRGVPQSLYVDNGSIYTSKEIVQICARVGCLLHHAPVRDGAAKGKVERFFRTVRDQFLIRNLDLSSLDALNRAFTEWAEEQYNAREHSVLGMTPLDRYALDRSRVRFLPPNETNDELFFVEEDRLVRADNTFSFKGVRFEAPRHLPDRTVQVRFQRSRPTARLVVYYKGERMGEARPLNMIANDRKPINPENRP